MKHKTTNSFSHFEAIYQSRSTWLHTFQAISLVISLIIIGCNNDEPSINKVITNNEIASYQYDKEAEFNWQISSLQYGGYEKPSNAISLQFGPDNLLYVLNLDGSINQFAVKKVGSTKFIVRATNTLDHINRIPNHNDDGQLNAGVINREATSLTVIGTSEKPIIYVSSSDPRMGGPNGDLHLDTNSGIITRLTKGVNGWEAVDIVRGLPRSEENHATHGISYSLINSKPYLIVSQGGNTNAGAPSKNFAYATEYALSAAILAIDLTMIERMPIKLDKRIDRKYVYDLPTLDDPTRANTSTSDINDPFGGNNGLNQAKLTKNGPIKILAPGFRNSFDHVITKNGALYVTDNGPNGGWGGPPDNEGIDGKVTNKYLTLEPGSVDSVNGQPPVNNKDHLTLVTNDIHSYEFGTFYGGHPNPVRANPANAGLVNFNLNTKEVHHRTDPIKSANDIFTESSLPIDWPPVLQSMANPIEGDYRMPEGPNPHGDNDEFLTTWPNNTNAIAEYTATNYDGKLKGNLLAGQSGGLIHRVVVKSSGQLDTLYKGWVKGLGGDPLGITCQSDAGIFPGTIWVACLGSNIKILVPFKKVDCILPDSADYDPAEDNDHDSFSNYDERINNTDMCNGASFPPDFDLDNISNLLDLDDDNDGILDINDPLQMGAPFKLPVLNDLFSNNTTLNGYKKLGFTGLMSNANPQDNYLNWLDRPAESDSDIDDVYGGAVGVMTIYHTAGDAASNNQEKAFQFGVTLKDIDDKILVRGKMIPPFHKLLKSQSQGIFIGTGFQDNYVKAVIERSRIAIYEEVNDRYRMVTSQRFQTSDKEILIDIIIDTKRAELDITFTEEDNEAKEQPITILSGYQVKGKLQELILHQEVLAAGLIGTSGRHKEFASNWDFLNATTMKDYANIRYHYRVNVGGKTIASKDMGPNWISDEKINFRKDGMATNQTSHEVGYPNVMWHDTINKEIIASIPQGLLRTNRILSPKNQTLRYDFKVDKDQCYLVNIFMREGVYPPRANSARLFDIKVNEKSIPSLTNIDLANQYGFRKAIVKSVLISSNKRKLQLDFVPKIHVPTLSGIEIYNVDERSCKENVNLTELTLPPHTKSSYPHHYPNENSKWRRIFAKNDHHPRHENSFVYANGKFYLFGGRENADVLEIYDPETMTWSKGAVCPKKFNHCQAVEYDDKIWVLGAFSDNNFPNESSQDYIYTYDPAKDTWQQEFKIPENRSRGAAGVCVVGDLIYIVGGNIKGHEEGYVSWTDVYDPVNKKWEVKSDAPHERDHFHAVAVENKIYAIGGRKTGGDGGVFLPTVDEIDIYNIELDNWTTLPKEHNIPTGRAGSATATYNNIIYVLGGESSNEALTKIESFDTKVKSWTVHEDMATPRHGTQAVVLNSTIYMTAGSPKKSEGKQTNFEKINLSDL